MRTFSAASADTVPSQDALSALAAQAHAEREALTLDAKTYSYPCCALTQLLTLDGNLWCCIVQGVLYCIASANRAYISLNATRLYIYCYRKTVVYYI
jgi:hypothetical protein